MRPQLRRKALLAVGLFYGSLCVGASTAMAAGTEALNPDMQYIITFAVSKDQVSTLQWITVLGVVKIGSKEFLMVKQSGYKMSSFIALDAVRSIIPSQL